MTYIDTDDISNEDLALCVDEYVKRAFAAVRVRDDFDKDATRVVIEATQYGKDAEFTVKHSFQLGDNYGSDGFARSDTNNAIDGAHSCIHRLYIDRGSAPKKYSTLLPAPEPELELVDEVEPNPIGPMYDAEIEEIDEKGVPY